MSVLKLLKSATPESPETNKIGIYCNTDGQLSIIDEDGNYYAIMREDGWVATGETWTYASADDPTFTFTISGDKSTKYQVGQRIKLTQTTAKYFIITKVAYSSPNTTITVYGGVDYDLANAEITSPFWSNHKQPLGFPLDPDKWTVTVTDTGNRAQSNPTQLGWYNLGSVSISVPIGIWDVEFSMILWAEKANAIRSVKGTLSTANNSESDTTFTVYAVLYSDGIAATQMARRKVLSAASKTTYYLNSQTGSASVTNLANRGDIGTTTIKAVCAYL